jgi:putative two-component system response regulator
VFALATLAECRDMNTGMHLERVTRYARLLAEALRADARFAETINDVFLHSLPSAMPLHDIGKVGIPDRILLKPGKLTPAEFATMRRHTALGAKAIQSIMDRGNDAGFLKMAHQIALSHHERYDGSGYPQGLAGEAIPLAARIAALADVYDALTSRRPYKSAFSADKAVRIIHSVSGSQFDPAVVAAFIQIEPKFAAVAVELSDAHGASASTTPPVRKPVLSGTSQ